MRFPVGSLLAVMFLLAFSGSAGAVDKKTAANLPDKIIWRSGESGEKNVPLALERLYMVLYNTQSLPVREYEGDKTRSVIEILKSEKLFFGSYFPEGIDSVMCDLNRHVCKRDLKPYTKKLEDPTKHIGGFQKSKGKWSKIGKKPLYLPDLDFAQIISFKPTPKPKGKTAEEVLAKLNLDCNLWYGLPCAEMVKALNAHAPSTLKADKKATPILPFSQVSTVIPLASKVIKPKKDPQESGGVFKKPPIESLKKKYTPTVEKWTKTSTGGKFSDRWQKTFDAGDAKNMNAQALKQDLYWVGKPKAQSHPSEPLYGEQANLLKSISHPLRKSAELPDTLKVAVKIGVLDSWLDEEHCDLNKSVSVAYQSGAPKNLDDLPMAGSCGNMNPTLRKPRDHGTHVTGLIAAKVNGQGIIGLNPNAQVTFHQIDIDEIQAYAEQENDALRVESKISLIILDMLHTKAINASWSYPAVNTNDFFLDLVKKGLGGKLLVVAAGNDAKRFELNGDCKPQPACANFPNIISVIGLKQNPTPPALWTVDKKNGSNFGPRFNIAAVGENVLSTAARNFVGFFSGTSQAAPQVTAAASFIYSIHAKSYTASYPDLVPLWVKNRLMYSADIFPDLLDKVYSGRLNIERAVRVNQDQFTIADPAIDGGLRHIYGEASFFHKGYDSENCSGADSKKCKSDTVIFTCSGKERIIPTKGIRRIFWNDQTNRYVVFYNESRESQAVKLERKLGCKLDSKNQNVVVETSAGTEKFLLSKVRDYVSAMFN